MREMLGEGFWSDEITDEECERRRVGATCFLLDRIPTLALLLTGLSLVVNFLYYVFLCGRGAAFGVPPMDVPVPSSIYSLLLCAVVLLCTLPTNALSYARVYRGRPLKALGKLPPSLGRALRILMSLVLYFLLSFAIALVAYAVYAMGLGGTEGVLAFLRGFLEAGYLAGFAPAAVLVFVVLYFPGAYLALFRKWDSLRGKGKVSSRSEDARADSSADAGAPESGERGDSDKASMGHRFALGMLRWLTLFGACAVIVFCFGFTGSASLFGANAVVVEQGRESRHEIIFYADDALCVKTTVEKDGDGSVDGYEWIRKSDAVVVPKTD